ncbi:response regulator [Bradyrhizobium sp. GCM10027634]|uniref:response regulator n=1 Tax=unclassified Bradyrhizobium TaxID=2631580 RepID=UPI00188A63DB|nr:MULTISPECIES: response regulator transcription factor [unclassified Bradyrhizobium]MDN5005419.1 response regulator transcription factor [Bradyrhizobium sp. WYCCWR 12677]QOZ44133.1 DNA-binding response regulator [Bradyrhizobium sp. CCBAU 53340]
MTMRILIGDDHPLVQAALRSALSTVLPDLDIVACQSLDEAVSVLSAQSDEIDLILWDLTMPGIQGFAALFILSAQFPTVPVAIISARQEAATIRRAIAYGASGYIPKSLGLPEMADAITKILAGEIWMPPNVGGRGSIQSDDVELAARMASLSAQQLRILAMIVEGKLNKQIAGELDIAEQTVKGHVSTILRKLGVGSRTQAAVLAERLSFGQPGGT